MHYMIYIKMRLNIIWNFWIHNNNKWIQYISRNQHAILCVSEPVQCALLMYVAGLLLIDFPNRLNSILSKCMTLYTYFVFLVMISLLLWLYRPKIHFSIRCCATENCTICWNLSYWTLLRTLFFRQIQFFFF